MSRKNLSRTVIEGGRYRRNQFFRNESHSIERANVRAWIDRVEVDLDEAEARAVAPRPRVHRMFYDKLAPAMRWLDRQVGRPWNRVYSELCAKFDRRTIAGNHVVADHMLVVVFRGDLSRARNRERYFEVDPQGILRRGRFHGRSFGNLRREMLAWSQQRFAANTSAGWWWFWKRAVGSRCDAYGSCTRRHDYVELARYHDVAYMPDRALSRGDLRRLDRLPRELRAEIVISARR
jgi:hypothetical protein